MTFAIYTMVAYGCNSSGMSFWRSWLWPVGCVRLIARAILAALEPEGGE